ncbi:hypothetical protein PRZ48_012926 [Zasmidium cellare]|uniref:Cell wall mannoprotein PIR1-like C-terminal domain-containing protein n=1 Tax=Zasmidium cellare TaxID=395010 RepID=A0ABR0E3H2_ZASCE|nr:hypothetical protein PRZ48_012926 [Zasmidium cellare]
MRIIAVSVIAGFASTAVAAAVSQSPSGKLHTSTSIIHPATTASPSLDSTLAPPLVSVLVSATPRAASNNLEAGRLHRDHSVFETAVIVATHLAQPTELPTPGDFKTIGCGCSYRFPNGYVECPYSGSKAPPGSCSLEFVTATKTSTRGGHSHTTPPTTSAAEGVVTTPTGTDPTSILSSIIAEATSWPSGVHPGMAPPSTPPAKDTCTTTLDGTFSLGQRVNIVSNKAASHVAIPRISLINGTLIDDTNRIGCIVANGQFQFDLPPQAGTIYTAGWSACGSAGDRTLALGGNTTLYACNSGDFSNLYHKPVGSRCAPVELAIVMQEEHGPTQHTAPEQQKRASTNTDFDFTAPSVSAIADSALIVDREAEPGFEGGFFNDQPAELNYLLTTKTITLPAQTGVDPAYDDTPETTWTLPATTLVITESPAPTKVLNARGDGVLGAIGSITYFAGIVASAESQLSAIESSLANMTTLGDAAQQTPAPVTAAPDLSKAVAIRQDHDAIWTIDQLLSTILSAKSASEYYSWVAQSISMKIHEATVTNINTACAIYEGVQSCKTQTLFFATQGNAARARAEATPTSVEAQETSVVIASVPVATITKVITASVTNGTTCNGNATSSISSGSSYVNASSTSVSYYLNTTLTSPSSAVVSPVTANNSTVVGHSTSTNTITTFVNATASQTSFPNSTIAQSTTAEVGGIGNKAAGGKHVALATVGMAFFAMLALFL